MLSTQVFVEDLPNAKENEGQELTLPGLVNLGNTCYMNSTVQVFIFFLALFFLVSAPPFSRDYRIKCLKAIPELREALLAYSSGTDSYDPAVQVTSTFKTLVSQLQTPSFQPVTPLMFVQVICF